MSRKILIVAASEFATAVKSKAFVIGVVMLPIFMGGSLLMEKLSRDHADVSDRRFAVVDGTPDGAALAALEAAAALRDRTATADPERREPRYVPVRVDVAEDASTEARGLRLSADVKEGRLFAFVVVEPGGPGAPPRIAYHTDTPTYRDLPEWIERTLADAWRAAVVRELGLAPGLVARLDARPRVVQLGLLSRGADGAAAVAEAHDPIRTYLVPMVTLFLLFMSTMSAAPQLLNAVLEEKQLRISEFLVSAVTAFDLMAGKLLGCVAVAALLTALYMGGAVAVAAHFEMLDRLPWELLPWFFAFLVAATLVYGSIFISIGAACSDLKDAQSMMSPAMLLVMLPVLVAGAVLKEPNGSFATSLSMFPLFSPVLMPLRLAAPPGPPWWQPPLALAATAAVTALFVWAAGRIFRVGVLAQGKGASFRDMLRWIRAK
ncbi:MAG TPA: ABC transporter permease [Planctomycetota bacterium]|nr:ABC transporter permease [Planctomycetota bacterium]